MINVCVLQLPTLSMSENRIDYYMKVAKDNGARIVLLGEYELNSFFSELKKMPRSIACEQSEHKQELMARLAAKYDLHIVAPIIRAASGAILRQAGIFSGAAQKSANCGSENSLSLKGEQGRKGELNSKSDLNSNDGSNSKGALNSNSEQSSKGGLNSEGALNSCGAHALNLKAANSADGLNLSASIPSNSNASNLKAESQKDAGEDEIFCASENEPIWVKSCAKFSPSEVKFYDQNILMDYPHWDEEGFFANRKSRKIGKISPMIFSEGGVKFGMCFGYEAHFDVFWRYFMQKNVGCVLVPCASTFESGGRWRELLKMRAFTNSLYVIRANRIGEAKFGDSEFKFYGESFVVTPGGEIANELKNEEGVLMCEVDADEIAAARGLWKFRKNLVSRGLL
ncbi:carbon-nitrogen hydrolase family protein [uncultured Campylobacter sp.]|uniref:carbon-nitrogen hydrolase family protein n=1 Tax=uncultured Campylobacter sp. TaxID=218934 RepID=UPI002608AB80|nr:carbon-nitrogen hydrolase family protein [uncultured Campylobacter sp.]